MSQEHVPQAILNELEDIQDEMEAERCRAVFEERLKYGLVTIHELMQMFDELENYRRQR